MRRDTRTWVGRGLIGLGLVLFAYYFGVALDSSWFQAKLARRLESIGRSREAATARVATATRREARTSGLIGRIEIPRLGVSAMVLEGSSTRALRRGVGHVASTAFPGEPGNVGLAGHRDTYFRPLAKARRGDRISLRTPDGAFTYVVDSILIVRPSRADLLARGDEPRLTLVTCYPFRYIGPAPQRFVIRARLTDPHLPVAAIAQP